MFRKIASLCSLVLLGTAVSARASSFTFDASGSGGDGPLSATAVFTVSNGQIQIVLTNDLSAATIGSVGQSISDISFFLSNAPGTVGTATATGQQGNIDSSGKVTYITGSPGRFIGVGGGDYCVNHSDPNCGTNQILLEAIGGSQPNELIFPTIANGGTYASLAPGANVHSPYTIGPGTFTLNLSGVTNLTTISDVEFSFGTGPDTFLPGTRRPPGVPEPSSLMLLGTGILGAAGLFYRRMSRAELARK